MALLPTEKDTKLGAADIHVQKDPGLNIGKSKKSSYNKKSMQIEESTLSLIRNIAYAKDKPMYKVVAEAMEVYLEYLDDNERLIFENRRKKEKEKKSQK